MTVTVDACTEFDTQLDPPFTSMVGSTTQQSFCSNEFQLLFCDYMDSYNAYTAQCNRTEAASLVDVTTVACNHISHSVGHTLEEVHKCLLGN